MRRDAQLELYQQAIMRWGMDDQLDQMVEELGELIVARSKLRRARDAAQGSDTLDQLAEEVADVLIMADQVRVWIGEERVDKIVDGKLRRLAERLGAGGQMALGLEGPGKGSESGRTSAPTV